MSKKRSPRNASKPSCNLSDLSTDVLRKLIRDEVRAVRDELKQSFDNDLRSLKDRLTNIDAQLQQALVLKDTVIAVEKAIDYTSQRLDDVFGVSRPALSRQVEQVAVGLALQTFDLDVHRGRVDPDHTRSNRWCRRTRGRHPGCMHRPRQNRPGCQRCQGVRSGCMSPLGQEGGKRYNSPFPGPPS